MLIITNIIKNHRFFLHPPRILNLQDYHPFMKEQVESLIQYIDSIQITDVASLNDYKRDIIGKNGQITRLFEEFKTLPGDQKREAGALLNQLKSKAQIKYDQAVETLENQTGSQPEFDYTLPGPGFVLGNLHPLRQVMAELTEIFADIGFVARTGPELEQEWFNFSALNFPADHPARDMQDTFFVEGFDDYVLRTHTSPVQVRSMLNMPLPLRVISPGRVYRCDSDATHSPVFHQVEGLYIDKKVSFADLKEVLYYFVQRFFGDGYDIRFRPSYFPFTEPSAEMDITWKIDGKVKWMEILGCGMVDPNVLKNCNIDPDEYSGFAFGIGVERLAMLRYKVKDIRDFYQNDVRFLDQFR